MCCMFGVLTVLYVWSVDCVVCLVLNVLYV